MILILCLKIAQLFGKTNNIVHRICAIVYGHVYSLIVNSPVLTYEDKLMTERDIDEKERMLSVVAIGCHKRIHEKINDLLKKDHETFFFYEYFLTKPLFKKCDEQCSNVKIFAPFLERLLSKMDFVPMSYKYENLIKSFYDKKYLDIQFAPKSKKAIKDFWQEKLEINDFFGSTVVGSKLYKHWNDQSLPNVETEPFKIEYNKIDNIVSAFITIATDYLKNIYLKDIGNKGTDSDALAKEFILVIYPWLRTVLETINVVCVSISTENLFYGYILLIYPNIKKSNDSNADMRKTLETSLVNYVRNDYAPLLALFENYWEEKMLEKELKEARSDAFKGTFKGDGEYIYASEKLENSNDLIEKSLWTLWDKRKTALVEKNTKAVEESLIFSKYLIGSPCMVEQIKTVMGLNLKKGNSLPAVLIVGSPGSGKDKMAKLVKLFSDKYRFGKEYVINMAMLRPKEITVPLLMGIDIKGATMNIQVDGIFIKAKEDNKDKKDGYAPVFIFDELNSLDIDSQGSLLRVIENAKTTALGSLKEEDVDFLIIGIMNEDPESITMQRPLGEILRKEKIFAGILGDILYEYFRKMRRLRDDLYYRIIRDGKIVIPDLKNRREDIPIMFYFFVKEEMKKEDKEFKIDIEVYEVLMENTLTWPGNFRQLQAIAKETIREAKNDKENPKDMLNICTIHVQNAIDKDKSLKSTS